MFVDDRPSQTANHDDQGDIQSRPHVQPNYLVHQQSAQRSTIADMVEIVLAKAETCDDSEHVANDEIEVELVHHSQRVPRTFDAIHQIPAEVDSSGRRAVADCVGEVTR